MHLNTAVRHTVSGTSAWIMVEWGEEQQQFDMKREQQARYKIN